MNDAQVSEMNAEDSIKQLRKFRPEIKTGSLKESLMKGGKDFQLWYDLAVTELPHLSEGNREKGLDEFEKLGRKSEITLKDMVKLLETLESWCPLLSKTKKFGTHGGVILPKLNK